MVTTVDDLRSAPSRPGVAVSVVASDSVFQPKNICRAEIFAEDFGVILFGESRISRLHFAEQHSSVVSSVPRPFTSMLPPSRTTRRLCATAAITRRFNFWLLGDDGAVFLVIRILGPPIKKEIVVGDFAGFIPDADGAKSRVQTT